MPADGGPSPTGAGPRVRVLTRQGCHLCDDALVVARRVCAELGQGLDVVDVDSDPQLRARFTDHVPVTLVDDRQVAMWVLDEDVLRAALASG